MSAAVWAFLITYAILAAYSVWLTNDRRER